MFSQDNVLEEFEKYLTSLPLPQQPEGIYAPIAYSLQDGGKRIRPMLLLTVAKMLGSDTAESLPCAAAVEVFHNFTLLHDDIMDNADVRRGKSSVHKKWGANIAILSGDAMVIYAYHLLQQTPVDKLPAVMNEFNRMALEVCEGQQYDMEFEERDQVSLDEYMNMIRLKTAVLFAGAAKIGALLAGASNTDCDLMYEFGLEIGLAYQLQDDYLDTYGTPEILGKNIGGDVAERKKTFLTITALSEAGEATRRAMLATLRDDNLPLGHKLSRIKTIYNSLDVPEITRSAIANHLNAAYATLDKLSMDGIDLAPLRRIAETISKRNK